MERSFQLLFIWECFTFLLTFEVLMDIGFQVSFFFFFGALKTGQLPFGLCCFFKNSACSLTEIPQYITNRLFLLLTLCIFGFSKCAYNLSHAMFLLHEVQQLLKHGHSCLSSDLMVSSNGFFRHFSLFLSSSFPLESGGLVCCTSNELPHRHSLSQFCSFQFST